MTRKAIVMGATSGIGMEVAKLLAERGWQVGIASLSFLPHIACITSIAGTKGLGAAPAYSATKRFQSHYLECLTQQASMRHLPISIIDIRPGFVKTSLIAGKDYPLQLEAKKVARGIVKTIEKGRCVKFIDWRYAILVLFWRLIPRWLWTRLTFAK